MKLYTKSLLGLGMASCCSLAAANDNSGAVIDTLTPYLLFDLAVVGTVAVGYYCVKYIYRYRRRMHTNAG